MNILSIQSSVAYGHVGNATALFSLQRLGAQVWAVNGAGDRELRIVQAQQELVSPSRHFEATSL